MSEDSVFVVCRVLFNDLRSFLLPLSHYVITPLYIVCILYELKISLCSAQFSILNTQLLSLYQIVKEEGRMNMKMTSISVQTRDS